MQKIKDMIDCIREMAPEELAEPWDNSGMLITSEKEFTESVVVCLDVTSAAVEKAISSRAHLIIAHHPLIFAPIKRIDHINAQGRLLRGLIRNDIALYAAHTNVDKTYGGLNDLLAGIIGLDIPIPGEASEPLSYYRTGDLPKAMDIDEFNEYIRSRLKLDSIIVSAHEPGADGRGNINGKIKPIKKVLVMCGAYSLDAGLLEPMNVDALLCGEIKYHDALDLAGMGIHIVQAGHHGTERFFIKLITEWIADKFPGELVMGVGFSSPPSRIYSGNNT